MKFLHPILRATLLIAAAVALIAVYMFLVELTGFMPRCPIKMITGFDCPGCGSQRALHALLAGDISGCVRHNFLLPFTAAYLTVCALHWIYPAGRRLTALYSRLTSSAALLGVLAVTVVWTIARNAFSLNG